MRVQRMAPFLVIALAMLVLGHQEIQNQPYWDWDAQLRYNLHLEYRKDESYLALGFAALAVGVAGRLPSLSLGLLWVLLGLHWLTSTPILLSEVAILLIGFACTAWGRRETVVASAVSIPAAAMVGVAYIFWFRTHYPGTFLAQLKAWGLSDAAQEVLNGGWGWGPTAILGTAALLLLSVPWLAGLLVRSRVNVAASRAEQARADVLRAEAEEQRDQAAELARLRESQTQLSRDVHDVVGHSLTVILAQAEAAQFTDDPERLKQTLSTITDTARSSLTDVRQVLTQTVGGTAPVPVEADVQALLDGVRAGGRDVALTDVGTPRPLPPDLAPVAHRVLQEMLTNAVRHGRPQAEIRIVRTWTDHLTLSVSNPLPDPAVTHPMTLPTTGTPRGQGLIGMARRLEAVGGRFSTQPTPDTFTAQAEMPLPGRQDFP